MSNTFNVIGTQDGRINSFGVWEDTEENRQRLLDWAAFGYKETPDEYVVGYDGEFYLKGTEPKYTPTYEEQRQARADAYASEVDPLMAEYNRKKTFNLFAEGEEEALLAEVNAKVEGIKQRLPYPVEPIEKIEQLPVVEEAVVSEMENAEETEEVIEDGLQREEKEIEEPAVEPVKDSDNEVVELYSMEI